MSSAVTTAVGERIRALREADGRSQEAFARDAGMDRAYLGRIERGRQNVSVVTLARIAGTLKVEIAELVDSVPPIPPANSVA